MPAQGSAVFDIQASVLRRAGTDRKAFAEGLAIRLTEALPGRVTIARSGWGILRDRRVAGITLTFEHARYTLAQQDSGWRAERTHLVHGVGLRTEQLGLAEWLEAVVTEVSREAGDQNAATEALQQFLLS